MIYDYCAKHRNYRNEPAMVRARQQKLSLHVQDAQENDNIVERVVREIMQFLHSATDSTPKD